MDITIAETWSTVGLILDIVLLAVMLLSVIRGARQGFAYGVVWLASIVAAVIAARLVSGLLTEPISDFFFNKSKAGVEKTADSLLPGIDGVDWSQLNFESDREKKLTDPEYEMLMNNEGFSKMAGLMTKLGMSRETQKERFYSIGQKIYEKQESGSEYVRDVAADLTHRVITFTVRAVLIIITFVVVLFVLRHLARGMARVVDKIPLVGTLDHVLGGALNGAVALALICLGLYVWHVVNHETYENVTAGTALLAIIKENNPLISFFG